MEHGRESRRLPTTSEDRPTNFWRLLRRVPASASPLWVDLGKGSIMVVSILWSSGGEGRKWPYKAEGALGLHCGPGGGTTKQPLSISFSDLLVLLSTPCNGDADRVVPYMSSRDSGDSSAVLAGTMAVRCTVLATVWRGDVQLSIYKKYISFEVQIYIL
jgi:hypothetical protein